MIEKIKNREMLKENIRLLTKIKRRKHHPLIHHMHKKHGISHKTLFYIKEYGPHSNISGTIVKESIFILILTSFMSAFGGIALERMKELFITIIPFVILYPTLNDMIGDYGSIISAKFGTMLHEGKIKAGWFTNKDMRKLFYQIMIIATGTGILSAIVAIILSQFSDYAITSSIAVKILFIVIFDVALLVALLFMTSISAGRYYFNKNEDPNNFLIPIATSIADLGNGLLLAGLIYFMF